MEKYVEYFLLFIKLLQLNKFYNILLVKETCKSKKYGLEGALIRG